MQNKWAHRIATVGHIGCAPYAPGTWGSLAAIPLILTFHFNPWIFAALAAAVLFLGLWAGGQAACDAQNADPQNVVIDEVCGMLVTFLWIPLNGPSVVLGFFLFRFFDITKPPPARALERLHGGFGIMLDDVMAGIYANLLLRIGLIYAHL